MGERFADLLGPDPSKATDLDLAYSRVGVYPAEQLNAVAALLQEHAEWMPLSRRYGLAVLLVEAATGGLK